MKRFGHAADYSASNTNSMDSVYLFRMRLQLMIIMVKARLEGYPVGRFRKEAVLETASRLHKDVPRIDIRISGSKGTNHLFKERVRLLSVMATAMISDDYPLGIHRREAVLDNVETIVSLLFPEQDFSLYHKILQAA